VRVIIEIPDMSPARLSRACIALMTGAAAVGLIAEEEHGPAPALYSVRGLRFEREPFTDGEHFDLPAVCIARGWLDCDDAAIWRLMELHRHGERSRVLGELVRGDTKPGPRVIWRDGTRSYHGQIRRADGSWEDPTKTIATQGRPV